MNAIVLTLVCSACVGYGERVRISFDQTGKISYESHWNTEQDVAFQDADGDWIRLVIEKGQVNQYVNDELVHRGLADFAVDQHRRMYTDQHGSGKFKPGEDVSELARLIQAMFQREKAPGIRFQDADGDWIELVMVEGQINQYVNDELVRQGLKRFEIDQDARTYTDDEATGGFRADEDLGNLDLLIHLLFDRKKTVEVKFQDVDGDWIRLVVEEGRVNQYVNNELVHHGLALFEIDEETGQYTDRDGSGKLKSDEDVPELKRLIGALFQSTNPDEVKEETEAISEPGGDVISAAQPSKQEDNKPPPKPRTKADSDDFYERLGIGQDADDTAIKKAYRNAAKQWHPDKNVDSKEHAEQMFRNVAEAYDVLSDAGKRAEYDRELLLRKSIPTSGFYHGECTDCSSFDHFFGGRRASGAPYGSRGRTFGGGGYYHSFGGGGGYYSSSFGGAW